MASVAPVDVATLQLTQISTQDLKSSADDDVAALLTALSAPVTNPEPACDFIAGPTLCADIDLNLASLNGEVVFEPSGEGGGVDTEAELGFDVGFELQMELDAHLNTSPTRLPPIANADSVLVTLPRPTSPDESVASSPGSASNPDLSDSGIEAESDSDSSLVSLLQPASVSSRLSIFETPQVVPTKYTSSSKIVRSRHPMKAGPPHQPQPRTSQALVASITARERGLLESKGETVPTAAQLPLTKSEERKLRAALRRIRNKDSAIRSRKKKEEYVTGLEHRVEECTRVNVSLTTKVSALEQTNRSLLQQLSDLRRQLAAQAQLSTVNAGGTVMMMVVVCCGLQLGSVGTAGDGSQFGYAADAGLSVTPDAGFRSRTLKEVYDEEGISRSTHYFGVDATIDDSSILYVAAIRWFVGAILVGALFWLIRGTDKRLIDLKSSKSA